MTLSEFWNLAGQLTTIIDGQSLIVRQLISIRQAQLLITQQQGKIMANLDKLTQDVTDNKDAVSSAIALLNNISGLLKAAGTDPVALAALASSLETNTAALAAAVVANTPVV